MSSPTYNLNPTKKNPSSVRELMDEELARKMQAEDERSTQKKSTNAQKQRTVNSVQENADIDEELRLAIELSMKELELQEQMIKNPNSNQKESNEVEGKQEVNKNEVDEQQIIAEEVAQQSEKQLEEADYALALQLQQEYESDRAARHLHDKEMLKSKYPFSSPHSKVTYVHDTEIYQPQYEHGFPLYSNGEFYDEEEEEEDDEYSSEEEELIQKKPHHQAVKSNGRQSSSSSSSSTSIITKHDPVVSGLKNAEKLVNILNSGDLQTERDGGSDGTEKGILLYNKVFNSLKLETKRHETHQVQVRGNKGDKSTSEQVMDQSTRVLLLKFMNSDILSEINGIISTGKEANVYHAKSGSVTSFDYYDDDRDDKDQEEEEEEENQQQEENVQESHQQDQDQDLPSQNSVSENNKNSSSTVNPTTTQPQAQFSVRVSGRTRSTRRKIRRRKEETIKEEFVPLEYAVKIYKTTLNEFKNRSEYIEGEYRFRHKTRDMHMKNTRKFIRLWAEKEMRNLKRLQKAGVPSPTPVLFKDNILIMGFIGKEGIAAPRLKDAAKEMSLERMNDCYRQCITYMRRMYQRCRLVHADLSEYNILYLSKQIYFIDVSQSVENDHPKAMEFLRKDCTCMTDFFKKRRASNVLSVKQLFDFVTDSSIQEKDEDNLITQLMEEIEKKANEPQTAEEMIGDAVFQSNDTFIPRTLTQVRNPLSEIFNDSTPPIHQAVTGVKDQSPSQ